ncbi:MAG: class I tRNA ligase family protein, partial [Acidimicrobiales bacterium]
DEQSGTSKVVDEPADDETRRMLHRTIAAVRTGMDTLRFNVSVAKLTELNNHLTGQAAAGTPREVAEPLVLMLAPLAPHVAEELWSSLGHDGSLAWTPFPQADARWLAVETIEIPVQVDGRLRAKVTVPAGSDDELVEATSRTDPRIAELLEDQTVRRVVVVPGRLVNFVLG